MNTFIIIKQTKNTLTNSHLYFFEYLFTCIQAQYHRSSIPSNSKSCSKIYYKKKPHGKKKRGVKTFHFICIKQWKHFFFIKLRQEFCFLKRKAMEYLSEYFLSKGCVLMFCAYLSQSHKRGHSNG